MAKATAAHAEQTCGCVYRQVEAEDVEHAKEQVREGSVAYDQATTEDDPGEVETILSVEEEE